MYLNGEKADNENENRVECRLVAVAFCLACMMYDSFGNRPLFSLIIGVLASALLFSSYSSIYPRNHFHHHTPANKNKKRLLMQLIDQQESMADIAMGDITWFCARRHNHKIVPSNRALDGRARATVFHLRSIIRPLHDY
jgi:tetrahydromethanopterin S-methyltransferase subunit E